MKEPRNFVRNNVFAKAGCERTAYHVRSWMESPRCKDDIISDDDIECMYNATCRVAMFKALREESLFQQCVPVYSVFYGSPSKIYTPPHRKWERKLSLEFSAPSQPANGKPDSLHPCGAARWCREPYSGAIPPRG